MDTLKDECSVKESSEDLDSVKEYIYSIGMCFKSFRNKDHEIFTIKKLKTLLDSKGIDYKNTNN